MEILEHGEWPWLFVKHTSTTKDTSSLLLIQKQSVRLLQRVISQVVSSQVEDVITGQCGNSMLRMSCGQKISHGCNHEFSQEAEPAGMISLSAILLYFNRV